MEDVRTGAGPRVPSEVLRRLALVERIAARAVSHTRVADAVMRRRAPKLLSASTRLAAPAEFHALGATGGAAPVEPRWSVVPQVSISARGLSMHHTPVRRSARRPRASGR